MPICPGGSLRRLSGRAALLLAQTVFHFPSSMRMRLARFCAIRRDRAGISSLVRPSHLPGSLLHSGEIATEDQVFGDSHGCIPSPYEITTHHKSSTRSRESFAAKLACCYYQLGRYPVPGTVFADSKASLHHEVDLISYSSCTAVDATVLSTSTCVIDSCPLQRQDSLGNGATCNHGDLFKVASCKIRIVPRLQAAFPGFLARHRV